MEKIFIVTASQTYQGVTTKRAFIEPNEQKAKKTFKELAGWSDRQIIEVDRIMIGQISINLPKF